jgi:hypothetical protein
MRNLLALLGAALVTFLAVGWYLDWYHITPKSAANPGHQGVEIDIDRKKIGEDVDRGIKVGEEKIKEVFDKDGKPLPATTSPR